MTALTDPKVEPVTPCLAMRPREAAKALGISERTLWEWAHRGEVPYVQIGKTIRYPVDALRRWLDERAAEAAVGLPPDDGAPVDNVQT
jgi:excisionase family DNA binding protein